MLSKVLALLVIFFPFVCHGQVVDVESGRYANTQGLHGSVEIGASLQKGNVDVFQYASALRVDYLKGGHHLLLIGSNLYGEDKGKAFQDESYGHLRWTSMSSQGVGGELFTQVQESQFKLLVLRHLVGGGARVSLLKEVVSMGLGGMSDYELLSRGFNELVARWNCYLRVALGAEVKASLVAYYQPRMADLMDYRLLGSASLEFNVNSHFVVLNQLNYSYDTRPPHGVVESDTQTRLSIKVKW